LFFCSNKKRQIALCYIITQLQQQLGKHCTIGAATIVAMCIITKQKTNEPLFLAKVSCRRDSTSYLAFKEAKLARNRGFALHK